MSFDIDYCSINDQQLPIGEEKMTPKEIETIARDQSRQISFFSDLSPANITSGKEIKDKNHDNNQKEKLDSDAIHCSQVDSKSNSISSKSVIYPRASDQIFNFEISSKDILKKGTRTEANIDLCTQYNRKKTSSPFPKLRIFPQRIETSKIASGEILSPSNQNVSISLSSLKYQNFKENLNENSLEILKKPTYRFETVDESLQQDLELTKCAITIEDKIGQMQRQESRLITHNLMVPVSYKSRSSASHTSSFLFKGKSLKKMSIKLHKKSPMSKKLNKINQQNVEYQRKEFQKKMIVIPNLQSSKIILKNLDLNLEDDTTEEWETIKTKSCNSSTDLSGLKMKKEAMELKKLGTSINNKNSISLNNLAERFVKFKDSLIRDTSIFKKPYYNQTTYTPYSVEIVDVDKNKKNSIFKEPILDEYQFSKLEVDSHDQKSYGSHSAFEKDQMSDTSLDLTPQINISNSGYVDKSLLDFTTNSKHSFSRLHKYLSECFARRNLINNLRKKLHCQINRNDQNISEKTNICNDLISRLYSDRDSLASSTQASFGDLNKVCKRYIINDKSNFYCGNKNSSSLDIGFKKFSECDYEDSILSIGYLPENEYIVACYDDGPRVFSYGKSYSISDFGSSSINSQVDLYSDYKSHPIYNNSCDILSSSKLYGQIKSQRRKEKSSTRLPFKEHSNLSSTDLSSSMSLKDTTWKRKMRPDSQLLANCIRVGMEYPKKAYFKGYFSHEPLSMNPPLKKEWKLMYTPSELHSLENGGKIKKKSNTYHSWGRTTLDSDIKFGKKNFQQLTILPSRENQGDVHKDIETCFDDKSKYDGKKISIILLITCISFPPVLFPIYSLGGFDYFISVITNGEISQCNRTQKYWALWAWLPSWLIGMVLLGICIQWIYA
ncbi:hypothetical protein HI914_00360 [Erysiphe necator]|nr:hypothetical protein HI914_00360 [Erysiphe necator]